MNDSKLDLVLTPGTLIQLGESIYFSDPDLCIQYENYTRDEKIKALFDVLGQTIEAHSKPSMVLDPETKQFNLRFVIDECYFEIITSMLDCIAKMTNDNYPLIDFSDYDINHLFLITKIQEYEEGNE